MVTYTNALGLPDTLMRAVMADPYDKGDADFSATELLLPPQLRRLKEEHYDEIVVDVSDRIWALIGRAVHNIMEEHAHEDHTIEERIFKEIEVDGRKYTVSGALDVQEPTVESLIIRDWKVTSTGKLMWGDTREWEEQLNVYQWLKGRPAELEVVALARDWQKKNAGKMQGKWKTAMYPTAPAKTIPLKSWPLENVEAFIADRIRLHTEDPPRRCTKDETWNGIRCADWCDVAPFCNQYQQELFK